ncbi:hypothetical protein [Candidatus Parabeggiatoa sp. HSG14]|uniref:hypothetical protein n=1 Tax=Candidatus Parabeggiatoa sp. HSG14 TaxID=3055593 RepID=UPI0025A7D856|nr:hypothetical protein [Thiotrichales bacterium HSG14]
MNNKPDFRTEFIRFLKSRDFPTSAIFGNVKIGDTHVDYLITTPNSNEKLAIITAQRLNDNSTQIRRQIERCRQEIGESDYPICILTPTTETHSKYLFSLYHIDKKGKFQKINFELLPTFQALSSNSPTSQVLAPTLSSSKEIAKQPEMMNVSSTVETCFQVSFREAGNEKPDQNHPIQSHKSLKAKPQTSLGETMSRKQYDWSMPDEIKNRLGTTTYGRQRALFEKDYLLLILHAPPKSDQESRDTVIFLRQPDGKLLCNGLNNGEHRLHKLIGSYHRQYQSLHKQYQLAKDAQQFFDIIEATTPISRAAQNMICTLNVSVEMVKEDIFLIGKRDEAEEVARNFELLLLDSKSALDFRLAKNVEDQAKKSEQMAIAQHKLNVLAAMTFPILTIAAIFGMNVHHGLETENPVIFWLIFMAGLIIGLSTKNWLNKK